MDLSTVDVLQPLQLALQPLIFQLQVLILMHNRVIFELHLRHLKILPAELILQLD